MAPEQGKEKATHHDGHRHHHQSLSSPLIVITRRHARVPIHMCHGAAVLPFDAIGVPVVRRPSSSGPVSDCGLSLAGNATTTAMTGRQQQQDQDQDQERHAPRLRGPAGKVWRGSSVVGDGFREESTVQSAYLRCRHSGVLARYVEEHSTGSPARLYIPPPISDRLPSRPDLPPSGRQLPCFAEPWASEGLSIPRPRRSPVVGPAAAVLSGHFGLSSADFAVTPRLTAPATSPLACPNPALIGLSVPPQTRASALPPSTAPRPASRPIASPSPTRIACHNSPSRVGTCRPTTPSMRLYLCLSRRSEPGQDLARTRP